MIDPSLFHHPLMQFGIKADNSEEELVDTWTACAFWLYQAACGDKKATDLAIKLINGANPLIDANALIQRCQQSDKAAIRQATALMNAQLTTAFDQAFENT
jgi:hypothetical protein